MAGNLGIGSSVGYSSTGSVFTSIPNCKSIELPSLEFSQVDTSNLSTTGNVKTSIPAALATPSKMTVEALYDPTTSAALLTIEGLSKYWLVTVAGTSSATFSFQGFISGVKRSVKAHDELTMMTIEVQMTGPIVEA